MKKALLYFIAGLLTLSACRKDDKSVFDKSPDERINETLGKYQAALAGSQYGWNAELKTAGGSIYHFHFSFNNANRVQMYGDIDTLTAGDRKESSYRLKALQQPSLIFDTYSYLHQLADPDGAVNGGQYGSGLKSDFEFSLDTLATDSIKLTGRFNGSKMMLKKATQQDLQVWQNGQWKNILLFEFTGGRILNYFKILTVGGTSYEMRTDPASRTVVFIWRDGSGTAHQHVTPYYFNSQGVQFLNPLVNGATTISSVTNIAWDANAGAFTLNINGGAAATIAGGIAPIVRDLNAPARWWNEVASIDRQWVTLQGFHKNGVDDAFGITKMPNFVFLGFFPQFDTFNGVLFDLAGFVLSDNGTPTIFFGSGYRPPVFTTNGRVIFSYYVNLGTGNIPPGFTAAYSNTANQFNIAAGFYLIQTGARSYDMVSADDAKTWITWIR